MNKEMNETVTMGELKFKDISSEEYRAYSFPSGVVRIESPVKLNVAKSGGHRILDSEGVSHYIPSGWTHLHWKAREGQPNFVF